MIAVTRCGASPAWVRPRLTSAAGHGSSLSTPVCPSCRWIVSSRRSAVGRASRRVARRSGPGGGRVRVCSSAIPMNGAVRNDIRSRRTLSNRTSSSGSRRNWPASGSPARARNCLHMAVTARSSMTATPPSSASRRRPAATASSLRCGATWCRVAVAMMVGTSSVSAPATPPQPPSGRCCRRNHSAPASISAAEPVGSAACSAAMDPEVPSTEPGGESVNAPSGRWRRNISSAPAEMARVIWSMWTDCICGLPSAVFR